MNRSSLCRRRAGFLGALAKLTQLHLFRDNMIRLKTIKDGRIGWRFWNYLGTTVALEVGHKVALRVVASCEISALVSYLVAVAVLGHHLKHGGNLLRI